MKFECYQDKVFCSSRCANRECNDHVTPGVKKRAFEAGLPLAIYPFKTECDRFKPVNDGLSSLPGQQ